MDQSIQEVIFALNDLKEDAFNEYNESVYDFCNETLDKLYKLIEQMK